MFALLENRRSPEVNKSQDSGGGNSSALMKMVVLVFLVRAQVIIMQEREKAF